jgi:hypothetical protein
MRAHDRPRDERSWSSCERRWQACGERRPVLAGEASGERPQSGNSAGRGERHAAGERAPAPASMVPLAVRERVRAAVAAVCKSTTALAGWDWPTVPRPHASCESDGERRVVEWWSAGPPSGSGTQEQAPLNGTGVVIGRAGLPPRGMAPWHVGEDSRDTARRQSG